LRKFPLVFLIHQSLGAWGPMLAAFEVLLFVAQMVWNFGGKFDFSQAQWMLYGTPFYPVHVGLGLFVGWILGGTLRHPQMLWVWIIPLLAVLSMIVGYPLTIRAPIEFATYPPMYHLTFAQFAHLPLSNRVAYLFGWGTGIQPFIQVTVTLPFYSAIAYSLGALLARKAVRMPAFFETVRSLRIMRLILFVGVPWFCLKLALNWQQIAARYPAIHTWRGLFYILEGLWVMSVFITFVFAIAVSLVGRRFFLSRLFLQNVRAEHENCAEGLPKTAPSEQSQY
jgi:hypothetical protein